MPTLRILHLEDSAADALLVQRTLERHGFNAEYHRTAIASEYVAALENPKPDLILADSGVPGFSGKAALSLARQKCPEIPFVFVSGAASENQALEGLDAGAVDFVPKEHLWQLVLVMRRIISRGEARAGSVAHSTHGEAMRRLVQAVQELSLARDLNALTAIFRSTARALTGADGATFILREGDQCFYADEDAISPLWKGQRFPMTACVSGWAMLHRETVVIEDIYADDRVPQEAYRPTFVKSMVMVPIRSAAPVGAIGNYWARRHSATAEEIDLLQALANATAVAMENIQVYSELERRVEDRTIQLRATNSELEAFSYSVSHDLKAPLVGIDAYASLLEENYTGAMDDKGRLYVERIRKEARRMTTLIEDLLRFAQFARLEIHSELVSISKLAKESGATMLARSPERRVEIRVQEGLEAEGDIGLLRVAIENLVSNAWKYSAGRNPATIEFGAADQPDGTRTYFVRDNGVGFDMENADRLFTPFHRLHREEEFAGHGVGLATVQRIIHRHGGRIWARSSAGEGATFYFTLAGTRRRPPESIE